MQETEATVDRLEGDRAILTEENERNTAVPREWLPAAVREGDVVRVQVSVAVERTEELREEVRRLRASMERKPARGHRELRK